MRPPPLEGSTLAMALHTTKVTAPAGVCSRGGGLAQTGWQMRLRARVRARVRVRWGTRLDVSQGGGTDPGELRAWQGRECGACGCKGGIGWWGSYLRLIDFCIVGVVVY